MSASSRTNSEVRATKALQLKGDFSEAVEWVLEEGNLIDNEVNSSQEEGSVG